MVQTGKAIADAEGIYNHNDSDIDAPRIEKIEMLSADSLLIQFSEPIKYIKSMTLENFSLLNNQKTIKLLAINMVNDSSLTISTEALTERSQLVLRCINFVDLAGNIRFVDSKEVNFD